jgi:hypothetical protein
MAVVCRGRRGECLAWRFRGFAGTPLPHFLVFLLAPKGAAGVSLPDGYLVVTPLQPFVVEFGALRFNGLKGKCL